MDTKETYAKLVNELQESCPCEYCFLKFFICAQHPSPRILAQLKCVEKFKWEESEKENREISWEDALMRWSKQGHAELFANLYNDQESIHQVYRKIQDNLKK